VSRNGYTLASLPKKARVGTSSSRRAAQLLLVRPDLEIIDLRGNAGTRLRKALDPSGPYDAVIVALAALERLGRTETVSEVVPEDVMLPAPGQAAVALQCRDEAGGFELTESIRHLPTELETSAERAFLEGLGGGCAVPVAARARLEDDGRLHLRGRVLPPDVSKRVDVEAEAQVRVGEGGRPAARACGLKLADEALSQGAAKLLGTTPGQGGS
jgi:hydroxymethylbilane synthase